MKSFYNFDFEKYKNLDPLQSFVIEQTELVIKDENNGSIFKKIDVVYTCSFKKQDNWNGNKPTIIIPIKDNNELLEFTSTNLKKNNVHQIANIIIVDDRSIDDKIIQTSIKNGFSCLQVYNQKGFNFSMLNNIAALMVYLLGGQEIILWNSDLWTMNETTIPLLLEKHRLNKSVISGTKLVYPPIEMTFRDKEKIENKDFFEKIQFGGSYWLQVKNEIVPIAPIHSRRNKEKSDVLANCDKNESFVTGAFQIIDLEWFIESGGLNPSLSKNFQDVDLCLRAVENNYKVCYFGKDVFLLHDESISLEKEGKYDKQMTSDHYLFGKIWNEKIPSLVF